MEEKQLTFGAVADAAMLNGDPVLIAEVEKLKGYMEDVDAAVTTENGEPMSPHVMSPASCGAGDAVLLRKSDEDCGTGKGDLSGAKRFEGGSVRVPRVVS